MYLWRGGSELFVKWKIMDSKLFEKIYVQPASSDLVLR